MIGLDHNNLKILLLVQNNQEISVTSVWKSTTECFVMRVLCFVASLLYLVFGSARGARGDEAGLFGEGKDNVRPSIAELNVKRDE